MADHNNNLLYNNISTMNTNDLPPVPNAPKKTKPVHIEEVKQPEFFSGRPVPIMYKVAVRRRLCKERDESNVSPNPTIGQPMAPKKNKTFISLHSLLYKSPMLGRKPVAKRLFSGGDYFIDSQDLGSFNVLPIPPLKKCHHISKKNTSLI